MLKKINYVNLILTILIYILIILGIAIKHYKFSNIIENKNKKFIIKLILLLLVTSIIILYSSTKKQYIKIILSYVFVCSFISFSLFRIISNCNLISNKYKFKLLFEIISLTLISFYLTYSNYYINNDKEVDEDEDEDEDEDKNKNWSKIIITIILLVILFILYSYFSNTSKYSILFNGIFYSLIIYFLMFSVKNIKDNTIKIILFLLFMNIYIIKLSRETLSSWGCQLEGNQNNNPMSIQYQVTLYFTQIIIGILGAVFLHYIHKNNILHVILVEDEDEDDDNINEDIDFSDRDSIPSYCENWRNKKLSNEKKNNCLSYESSIDQRSDVIDSIYA